MLRGIFVILFAADAFSMTPINKVEKTVGPSSTSAIWYSMQMPDFSSSFPKSTWYDVADPTARRIEYEDGPSDIIMFATIGNNWPELNDASVEEKDPIPEPTPNKGRRQTWFRINPIRRARNLIRRVL